MIIPKPEVRSFAEAERRRLEKEERERTELETRRAACREALLIEAEKLKEKRKAADRARQEKYRKNLITQGLCRVTLVMDVKLLGDLDTYAARACVSRGEALSKILGGSFGRKPLLRSRH